MTEQRHIVALGGGGFLMEETPVLDDFILSLARRPRPRICFVPTASRDDPQTLARFYRAFAHRDCIASDLTLQGPALLPRRPAHSDELRGYVLDHDVIYVSGGNTANMLAMWRVHGLDVIFAEAWRSGVVLAGVSAGMICWFQSSITDSFGDLRAFPDGLGLLAGSACPHYDGDVERRPTYHRAVAAGLAAGWAADDGAALHFVDDALAEVVTSRAAARGYRVELRGSDVVETELPARQLASER
jgi:dipeptidase E